VSAKLQGPPCFMARTFSDRDRERGRGFRFEATLVNVVNTEVLDIIAPSVPLGDLFGFLISLPLYCFLIPYH